MLFYTSRKKNEGELHNVILTERRFHAGKFLLRYYLNVRAKTKWQKTLQACCNFMCAVVTASGTPELLISIGLCRACHSSDLELVLSRHFSQCIQKHDSIVVLVFHCAHVLAFPGTRKDEEKVELLGNGSKSLNGCSAEKWLSLNCLCLLTEN